LSQKVLLNFAFDTIVYRSSWESRVQ